jgi:hypothetical protein
MGLPELDSEERSPGGLARALLGQVGRFTCDVAHVQEVLGALYGYLDERGAWGQGGLTRVRQLGRVGGVVDMGEGIWGQMRECLGGARPGSGVM